MTVELASLKRNLNEERVSFSILCQRNACFKKKSTEQGGDFIMDCCHQKRIRVCWSFCCHCPGLPLLVNNTLFLWVEHMLRPCAHCSEREMGDIMRHCAQWWTRGQGSYRAAYGTCWRCHVIDDTFGFFYDFLEGALFRFLPLVLAHRNLDSHFLYQPLEDQASSSGFNWWEQPNTSSLLLLKVGHQTRLWLSTEVKSTTTQSTWYQVHLFAAFIWAPTKTVNCFGSYTLFRASPKSLQAQWF